MLLGAGGSTEHAGIKHSPTTRMSGTFAAVITTASGTPPLGPGLRAVGRVRPRFSPPSGALCKDASADCHTHSSCPGALKREQNAIDNPARRDPRPASARPQLHGRQRHANQLPQIIGDPPQHRQAASPSSSSRHVHPSTTPHPAGHAGRVLRNRGWIEGCAIGGRLTQPTVAQRPRPHGSHRRRAGAETASGRD